MKIASALLFVLLITSSSTLITGGVIALLLPGGWGYGWDILACVSGILLALPTGGLLRRSGANPDTMAALARNLALGGFIMLLATGWFQEFEGMVISFGIITLSGLLFAVLLEE